jgi:hypothetical protein
MNPADAKHIVPGQDPALLPLSLGYGGIPVEYGPGLLDRVRAAAPQGIAAALDTVGSDEAGEVSLALVADRNKVVTIAGAPRAKADGYMFIGASNPASGPFRARARQRGQHRLAAPDGADHAARNAIRFGSRTRRLSTRHYGLGHMRRPPYRDT